MGGAKREDVEGEVFARSSAWMSPEVEAIFAGGHFDASAALAGAPFEGHLPEDCRPECPYVKLLPRLAQGDENA
jgi:hypothetical protein